jgi:hypothetical protein
MQIAELLNVVEQAIEKQVERQARISFNIAWFAVQVKAIRERFHHNIQGSWRANPTKNTSGNCSISIEASTIFSKI